MSARARSTAVGLVLLVVLAALFYGFCGFYSVPPIGAMPEGRTILVWRNSGEQFFDSPDAVCMRRLGGVSLLCRGMALGRAPTDRIILRLPYSQWAYLQSTGGNSFDR